MKTYYETIQKVAVDASTKLIVSIREEIENAAKKGEVSISISNVFPDINGALLYFKKEGFKISWINNGYIISWGDIKSNE